MNVNMVGWIWRRMSFKLMERTHPEALLSESGCVAMDDAATKRGRTSSHRLDPKARWAGNSEADLPGPTPNRVDATYGRTAG